MNCKEFESMIHELVSRRVADKTKQLQALEHAGHCLWCALRFAEETRLTERLQAVAGTLQSQHAPVRVEEALLEAFRERNLRTRPWLLGLAGKRFWRGLNWGLVFAATVAIAWIVIFQGSRLHWRTSRSSHGVAKTQPLPASEVTGAFSPASAALKGGAARQHNLGGQAVRTGNAEPPTPDEFAGEMTSDFIPLGTCDDSQCLDEATLVRVTLPAEALLAFGLETESDPAMEGLVQADVAYGSNGVPFAIRFVN